jgi:hypothetical protein
MNDVDELGYEPELFIASSLRRITFIGKPLGIFVYVLCNLNNLNDDGAGGLICNTISTYERKSDIQSKCYSSS